MVRLTIQNVLAAACLLFGSVHAAATAIASTATTGVCATHAESYYRRLLDGPPHACPVPLGREGRRQHRWITRRNQTIADVVDDPAKDPADPRHWAPWTHRPYCGANSAFCVYTMATLPESGVGSNGTLETSGTSGTSGAQGLSVITTPEMAASWLHPHEFALYPHALDMFSEFASLPPAFTIGPSDKGLAGAVATRFIHAGEAVVVDRPVLLAHFKPVRDDEAAAWGALEDSHGLGTEDLVMRHQMWMQAVDQLPQAVAEQVRALHVLPKYQEDSPIIDPTTGALRPYSKDEAIFASNAIQVDLAGYAMKALYPNVARFNHDCRPNLVAHISPTTLAMTLWATRPIIPGEELTISYIPDPLPYAERQAFLKRKWQFQCQCSLCTGGKKGLRESDKRRERLGVLHTELKEAVSDGDMERALAAALEVRNTYVREGLLRAELMPGLHNQMMASPFGPPGLSITLGHLFLQAGDRTNAVQHLRAAVAELRWRSGGWPSQAQMEQMGLLHQLLDQLEE